MARANAATTESRADFAEADRHFPSHSRASGLERPWRQTEHRLARRFEPWLIRMVPVFITLFLVTLALAFIIQAYTEHDRILATAQKDIDFTFRMLAHNIDQTGLPEDGTKLAEQVEQYLPNSLRLQSHAIYLVDQSGRIVAQTSAPGDAKAKIDDVLGAEQPITTFGALAGVLAITPPDGHRVFAAAQNLPAHHQQLVMVVPFNEILTSWRHQIWQQSLLLLSVAALLSITAMAYFWQASRTNEAEVVCDEIRSRIDTALNRGKCGLWDWDIARGRIYWSTSMFEILGLDPRQTSLSFGEMNQMVHPGDVNLTKIAQAIAAEENQTIDQIFRMRNVAGHWVWLRMRAEVVRTSQSPHQHIVGIAMDISEEKNHRDTSHIADLRLRDAIDSISEAFVLWDANNCLAMCNAKYRELHKIPLDEPCIGLSYQDFLAISTPPTVQSPINFDAQKAQSARTYEAQLTDGRWLQINERRTRDGGYVSVGTDITKLKQHEEQLLQSERRLMGTIADQRRSRQVLETQAQQLADLAERYLEQKAEAERANQTKARFLANMSHELRTPLNAILGFSDMMKSETFGPLGHEKYLGYVQHINESGTYLSGIISDVLEMSRLESGDVVIERSEFKIQSLFDRLMEQFSPAAKKKNIDLRFSPVVAEDINADVSAIGKILQPLIHNAIKFTPYGGLVTVGSQLQEDALLLTIEDNGVGIAPEALEQLGRPFEQADAALQNGMKGSGLGLAIARSLAELHGGALEITSQIRRGTSICVTIPRCHNPGVQKQTENA